MRILFLSQLVPYPIDAGPKVRSFHVLQYLATAGHEVTLLAFRRPSDAPENIAYLQQFCAEVQTVEMRRSLVKDAWHFGRSLLSNRPFLIARDSVVAMHRLVAAQLAARPFDAIHVDQLWMAQYGLSRPGRSTGNGGLKRVLDQHNAVYLIPQRLAAAANNPLKRVLLRMEAYKMARFELDTCQQFDRVIWVTDEDCRALQQVGKDGQAGAGVTIPICIDPLTKPVIERTAAPRRVTFLGGLHWPPNRDGIRWFVREVWPQISAAAPDACLTIIGKSPPAELEQATLPNVDITGYVDDPTPYLAETAAFIVPLHAGGGMRVKIVDAWSWGLPIVSTPIGAEGVRFRDGDNLLLAEAAAPFAQAVIRLLQEPALRSRLGQGGRRTVEQYYDWRTVYRAWDQIYQPDD